VRDVLLTPAQVSALLGLADRKNPCDTLRYLRETHQLRQILVAGRWRVREADLRAYVAGRRTSEAW